MNVLSIVKQAFNLLSATGLLCVSFIFMYVVKKSTCCKSKPIIIKIFKSLNIILSPKTHFFLFFFG